jgi:tRNA/tmRNA/rRNA uracil-C5-methylase (TrmA/RlmC/RlmD family)
MNELRWGRPGVVDTILGYWYQAPVFAPFPVTGRVASEAITSALDALALDGETTLLETEAGIGAYTLPAAAAAGRVIGRAAPDFLTAAQYNAAWNEAANVLFIDRSMWTLAAILRSCAPIQRALVQLTPEAVPFETLYEAGVQRLVLLTTSARRLAEALAAATRGGFEAQSVTVIDSHPQTSRADIHAALEARRTSLSVRLRASRTLATPPRRAAAGANGHRRLDDGKTRHELRNSTDIRTRGSQTIPGGGKS